nr:response regulator [uncultured Flavobacterium sp.]
MFKKVLVAEDLDTISLTIVHALQELGIADVRYVKYCDDAYLKIKRAIIDEVPFDLLISDLSFKTGQRENKLTSGEDLIEAVKKVQPNIKTIIFSIEDKSFRIKSLFNKLDINAYVLKGRDSIPELKKTIQRIYTDDEKIISDELAYALRDKSLCEIENYDIILLKYLSKGLTVEEIVSEFRQSKITPNSISSLEKRINKLKIYFKANNNVHLIALAKDFGLV